MITDTAPPSWTGRDDGPGPEHARWHQTVTAWEGQPAPCLIGFACDEGVRRNDGRVGASAGPAALRTALSPLAARTLVHDAGDIVVDDADLESGQARLAEAVRTVLDAGGLPVVVGGGHEVAYGSGSGLARSSVATGRTLGVLNLDAHFDLRAAEVPTSGTPFRQLLTESRAADRSLRYAVAGISEANNTRALFDAADEFGVRVLLDHECSSLDQLRQFVEDFCADVDLVHLTIDLDALPASVAPGVSAPAGFGISLDAVRLACRAVATSGRLALLEVAELNPSYDIDGRTARTAARLIDEVLATRS
ncbi:formimidoylglutamase [Propionibacteriaceae bacterium Y1700]|uniref:formimidoylglutamase n=1 Tax=Microlunatus sp. Y1700 TaxID=3418487 RepID=UPI003DA75A10